MSGLKIGDKVTVVTGLYPRIGIVSGRLPDGKWKVFVAKEKLTRFCTEDEIESGEPIRTENFNAEE
ncbi:MAG: hypothetical protein WCE63_05000 [Acidobacteriaceae bacterium]